MKIRNLTFPIAGIAVLTSIVMIMHPYAESASTPLETLEGTYASIPANLSIGQNVSALNIPLADYFSSKQLILISVIHPISF